MDALDFDKSFPATSACAFKCPMALSIFVQSPVNLLYVRYYPFATKDSEIKVQCLENLNIVSLMYI